jgi:uncharacterized repeat protein (TIGR03803 family)
MTTNSIRPGSLPPIPNSRTSLTNLVLWLIATTFPVSPASSAVSAQVQVVFNFRPGPDAGRVPKGALLEDAAGYLYGTTSTGGTDGQGTVYRLKTDGTDFQVLHSFSKGRPGIGANPVAGLIEDRTDTLYGTTLSGSQDTLSGSIFRIQKDGTDYKLLHPFKAQTGEPRTPLAPLLLASNNRLYGITQIGASGNMGCVFALNPDGSAFSTLHAFTGRPTDGGGPVSTLVESKDGFLYGTTPAPSFASQRLVTASPSNSISGAGPKERRRKPRSPKPPTASSTAPLPLEAAATSAYSLNWK